MRFKPYVRDKMDKARTNSQSLLFSNLGKEALKRHMGVVKSGKQSTLSIHTK